MASFWCPGLLSVDVIKHLPKQTWERVYLAYKAGTQGMILETGTEADT